MYPLRNAARQTRVSLFPMTAMASIKLLVVSVVFAAVPLALYVRVDSQNSKAAVTVQAAERGKPYFNFRDGQEMRVDYRGEQNLTEALRAGQAQPRSLASIVLAGNAVPDLISGYAYNGMGLITVQQGNPDAFAPKDDSVFVRMQQGYNPDSLLPVADTYLVPESPDFLQVGDFNHDNRKDVLVAARGGDLFLLAGDGHGGLNAPEQISLPGRVTALTAGEFRALDGWTDVALGVEGPSGPALLIYDGVEGLSGQPMSFHLNAPATAVQIAGLDNDSFMDVAVAAGSEVDIIHGWGRKQEVDLQSRVERISVNNNARDLAVGFFIWNRAGSNQIAVLSDDGAVNILAEAGSDTRPFTAQETALFRRARLKVKREVVNVESLLGWQPPEAATWTTAREFSTNSSPAADPLSQNVMLRSHISFHETDDLLMLNGSQNKLDIVRQIDSKTAAQTQSLSSAGDLATISLDVTDAPAAVLALPQKLNGERSLVLMQKDSASPTIVPLAPTTITVDRIDDPSGAALPAASACTGAANDCSLRGAVEFANVLANAGSTIMIPAGTYTLATNGTGVGGCDGNTVGDLGINQATTITGAGSATTIIRQHGTGPSNNGDRVMCMNENFTLNLAYSFSGITVAGGRDGGGFGGGGIIGGEKGNTLTLTGVTISNNQVTGGNIGGGGIQITGGDLTVTNCLIGGTSAPGVSTDRDTVANSNTEATSSGGGLYFTPSAPMHTASTGNLVVTGTTLNHNTAFGTGGGGAEMEILAFASPGGIGTGTATFDTSTFTNNQATNGGGLQVASLPTTIGSIAGTVSFTSNSATNLGGAIFVGGSTLLLDGSTATISIAGNNTATNGGSSIGTNGAVTVSGTNTTIGGDASVFTNGTWTNNAGSAISPTNFSILGGTLTCNNSTMNVSGNFVLSHEATHGGILNANTGTINVQGNLNVDLSNGGSGALGQFNAGTGTFNFNGTGAQSITNASTITFNNLTNSNTTQPLTANNSFAVGGTLNVNGANAIFAPVAGAVISGAGTLTGTGTARVTRTGADAFFSQYTITNKTLTNLTVEYIGAAGQTASTTTYGSLKINNASGVTLGAGTTTVNGTLTLTSGAFGVGTNTLVINNGTSVGAGSLTSALTGTVNYNQSSSGQNVIAANYGNLTFSAFTKVLASSGTIGIAGTFNTNGVTSGHTITGSTIDFNGTGAQTVPIFDYNNLTISGARTTNNVTLGSGTINVAGNFTSNATFTSGAFVVTGNTINFNGGGAQNLNGSATSQAFNNFTVNKSGGTLTVGGSLTSLNIGGVVTLTAGGFNAGTATSITMSGGDWTNNGGTFTPASSVVSFTNTAAGQNINGTATTQTFNGITVAKTAQTLAVGGNTTTLTLNGSMTLTSGTFDKGTATAINVGGDWTNNGGTFTPGTGTVTFNGGAAQNLNGSAATQTFNNFTVNKGGGTLTGGGSTTTLTLNGGVTLTAGTFAAGTIANIGLPGDWINNSGPTAFTAGTGTVNFGGSSGQTISGSASTTFNNLTNGDAGGIAMNNNNALTGILALTSSDITVASGMTLTQLNTGSSSGSFDVNGNLQRTGIDTAVLGTTFSFGNPNNQITVTAGTRPATITVNLVRSVPTGTMGYPTAVQRTYTITPSASGFTGTLRLHYLPAELNGNDPTLLNLWRFDSTLPTPGWRPNVATSRDCAAGCNSNTSSFWAEKTGVTTFSPWTLNSTNAPTASNGTVSGRITSADGTPVAGAVINLSGSQTRKTITDANGIYQFDNVSTDGFYVVTPSRFNYTFSPSERSFSQIGNNTEALFTGSPTAISVNPLDMPEYFVRQHYLDFLGREPDESGFNFWSDQVLTCGSDAGCVERKRINVSAAYFLSIEFQQTGGLVDGLYRTSYDRAPLFNEFMPDSRSVAQGVIVGRSGWEGQLETNKQAFIDAFVQRPTFVSTYGSLSDAGYVDELIRHTGVTFTTSEKDALVAGLADHTMTRATVLRQVAENERFVAAKSNQSFVLMEYFGYLRRDPDAEGYQFWLNKLNQFGGNFEQAEMVKAFIGSGEYRERFSR